MRVEATVRRVAVARPAGGGETSRAAHAFSVVVDNDAAAATEVPESGAAGSIAALLALQTVGDPLSDPARAVQKGRELLDDLDALKLALLEGRVPIANLERLASVVAQRHLTGDERLDQVLAEIELRARVELAKHGRYPK